MNVEKLKERLQQDLQEWLERYKGILPETDLLAIFYAVINPLEEQLHAAAFDELC